MCAKRRADGNLKFKFLLSNLFLGKSAFVSYPKSGRTWMRYVLRLADIDVRFNHAGSGHSLKEIGEDFLGVDKHVLARKNVFMYRNPLDTAVSMYFETSLRSLHPSSEGFAEKIKKLNLLDRTPPANIQDFVLDPVWGVERVCKFNRGWLDFFHTMNDKHFHVLMYESARSDPEREIKRLLDFFNASSKNLAEIVRKTQFEEMQKLESSLAEPVATLRLGMQVPGEPESMKVRKGKVGGYMDYLSPEAIDECRRIALSYGFGV